MDWTIVAQDTVASGTEISGSMKCGKGWILGNSYNGSY